MADRSLQTVQDTLRLPLYTTENVHSDLSSAQFTDQFIQNMIPQFHIDPSNETKEQSLVKRPGIKLVANSDFMTGIVGNKSFCTILDAIPITALYDVFVIAVLDTAAATVYIIMARPATASFVKIGSFTPGGATQDDFCFLTEYSQSSGGSLFPAVAVSWTKRDLTVSKGYYATSAAGVFALNSLTEITSTGFPPKQTPALISIGRFVSMNGTVYIASLDGSIWNSAVASNDITTWSNGVIKVNSYPDQCLGLARYKHHVVAFGRASIQFFNDVGDTPGPLASTEQAFIKFGVKSPRCIRNVNDVLYWLGYGEQGVNGIWQLDGYTPVKLSTPWVDYSLNNSINAINFGDSCYLNIQACTMFSKPHLVINFNNSISSTASYAASLPAFLSVYPTGVEGVSDTYALAATDFQPTIACYNIEDRTWWMMEVQGRTDVAMVCAGTSFNTPNQSNRVNFYSQILLYNPVTQGGIPFVYSQQYMYQFNDTVDVCKDEVGDAADTKYPSAPITTLVQTNAQWFGNEKRKRINKLKVLAVLPTTSSTDTLTLYVMYAKDLVSDVSKMVTTRGVRFPNSFYRYYLNNLGTGRAWTFCLIEKSKNTMAYRGIEVDVQQGSH